MILRRIAPYRKAVLAAIMAWLSALAAVLPDGITLTEAMGTWIAGMLSGLGVYATPNAPERPADDSANERYIAGRRRSDPGSGPA